MSTETNIATLQVCQRQLDPDQTTVDMRLVLREDYVLYYGVNTAYPVEAVRQFGPIIGGNIKENSCDGYRVENGANIPLIGALSMSGDAVEDKILDSLIEAIFEVTETNPIQDD